MYKWRKKTVFTHLLHDDRIAGDAGDGAARLRKTRLAF
jgi:hypothetical protein